MKEMKTNLCKAKIDYQLTLKIAKSGNRTKIKSLSEIRTDF